MYEIFTKRSQREHYVMNLARAFLITLKLFTYLLTPRIIWNVQKTNPMWIKWRDPPSSILPKPVEVYSHKPLCAPSLQNRCRNQARNIFQNIIELFWVQHFIASQPLNSKAVIVKRTKITKAITKFKAMDNRKQRNNKKAWKKEG